MHPFSFTTIEGHQNLKEALIDSRKKSKISHAQLFIGKEGSPNLLIALAYAKYLICLNPSESDSCGNCLHCKQFDKRSYPDIHFSFPYPAPTGESSNEITSKIHNEYQKELHKEFFNNPFYTAQQWRIDQSFDNKMFNIHVKEASLLISKLGLKSYSKGPTVVITWLPETLNEKAANKLLKLIEEPPKEVIFLLVSHDLERILPTIRSRVQISHIHPLTRLEVTDYAIRLLKISEEEAANLVDGYDSDLAKILEIFKDDRELKNKTVFAEWMRYCFSMDGKGIYTFVEKLAQEKKPDLVNFINTSLQTMERALTIESMPSRALAFMPEETNFKIEKFSKYIHSKNAEKINEILNEGLQDINRNGNKKIILMDISLKLANALKTPR